jgi:hypothetical protein
LWCWLQIPVVRACLSTRLPKQHAVLLNVFDNVASDYRNHQIMILSKLVDIVKARSSFLSSPC